MLKFFQYTGPMLHYANGKMVVGDEATLSNVMHVHRLCVDWYVFLAFLVFPSDLVLAALNNSFNSFKKQIYEIFFFNALIGVYNFKGFHIHVLLKMQNGASSRQT